MPWTYNTLLWDHGRNEASRFGIPSNFTPDPGWMSVTGDTLLSGVKSVLGEEGSWAGPEGYFQLIHFYNRNFNLYYASSTNVDPSLRPYLELTFAEV